MSSEISPEQRKEEAFRFETPMDEYFGGFEIGQHGAYVSNLTIPQWKKLASQGTIEIGWDEVRAEAVVRPVSHEGTSHEENPAVEQTSSFEVEVTEQVHGSGSVGHPSEENPSSQSSEPAMEREELKAHLDANEARVEQMTERIGGRLDNVEGQLNRFDEKMEGHFDKVDTRLDSHLDQVETRLDEFKAVDDKIESNTKWAHRFSVATLVIVSLILAIVSIGLGVLFNVISAGG